MMDMLASGSDFVDIVRGNMLWVVGGTIAVCAILSSTISSMVNTRARERSRREIAAYIAEGSMTPDQGEKLMNAAQPEE